MTLILRRAGGGNWSTVVLTYNPSRQAELPTPVQVKRGDPFQVGPKVYKVSRVLP